MVAGKASRATVSSKVMLPMASMTEPRKVLVTGWGVTRTRTIGEAVTRRGQTVTLLETGTTPTHAGLDGAVAQAAANDLVVVSTVNAAVSTSPPASHRVGGRPTGGGPGLAGDRQTGRRRGMRNLYDISHLPGAPTYLATYGYTAGSIESLIRVVFGEINPTGKAARHDLTSRRVGRPLSVRARPQPLRLSRPRLAGPIVPVAAVDTDPPQQPELPGQIARLGLCLRSIPRDVRESVRARATVHTAVNSAGRIGGSKQT
jgi:hypothetical protein